MIELPERLSNQVRGGVAWVCNETETAKGNQTRIKANRAIIKQLLERRTSDVSG